MPDLCSALHVASQPGSKGNQHKFFLNSVSGKKSFYTWLFTVLPHAPSQSGTSSSIFAHDVCCGNLRKLCRKLCSCSSRCWSKLQIWRWLHLVCVPSLLETTGPHISQNTYGSCNSNAQLPGEQAGRRTTQLGGTGVSYEDSLLAYITSERGRCYTMMEARGLETGKKTGVDFSWNILPRANLLIYKEGSHLSWALELTSSQSASWAHVDRAPKGKAMGKFTEYFPFRRGRPWLDYDCQAMPCLGKVVTHQETANQPLSDPGSHTPKKEGKAAAGRSLVSPGIS